MNSNNNKCRVCSATKFKLYAESSIDKTLDSSNFAITNFDYGVTGKLLKCKDCGFIQCFEIENTVKYYQDLVDNEYENTRNERVIQEKKIVELIKKYKKSGKLLDIGAGSGILIEVAEQMGFDVVGVEPSEWLCGKAEERGLNVINGVFPNNKLLDKRFDIITLIDVIEHVDNPRELITDIYNYLQNDGIAIVVTPNIKSLIARIMGKKWWHLRIAHIGYFCKQNFKQLINDVGFKIIKTFSPSWYFSLGYLHLRVNSYLPKFLRFSLPKRIQKISVSINLRDSILCVIKK